MKERIRILFVSANPWTTSRILVDEEAREIFEKLQEGPYRDSFELYKHAAIRPIDLQRLLMMYEPHIVHFSGHASKRQKIILGGTPGRGKEVDRQGLVELFALYKNHVRLVLLNACFTKAQARSLCEVIDYSVGTGKGIGDKGGVAFAGAFYRALGFGKSVKEAFESAKAELGLTKIPRTRGIELFVRDGISETDSFPRTDSKLGSKTGDRSGLFSNHLFASHGSDCEMLCSGSALLHEGLILESTTERADGQSTMFEASRLSQSSKGMRSRIGSGACLNRGRGIFEMLAAPGSSATELRAPSGKGLETDLTRAGKAKRAKRANPGLANDEATPRSGRLFTRSYVAVIVEFQRALIMDASDVSQT
jgi:hypothetical protein